MKNFKSFIQSNEIDKQEDDELTELSVNTLSSYGKKADKSNDKKLNKAADHSQKATNLYDKGTASAVDKASDHEREVHKLHKQVNKRDANMDRAAGKLKNKMSKGVAEAESYLSKTTMKHVDEINKQEDDELTEDKPLTLFKKDKRTYHPPKPESHQSKTTMKHIDKPNDAEKKAAKDIKPGIKGVRDRLAMLRAAKDRGALKEDDLAELSTKTLSKAAKSASDPDSDYSYGKSHDPQKFADHAKKTKDAKSAAAVQGAADAKSHYPRPGHTVGGNDTLADRTKSRITSAGKANKQDVKTLKSKIQGRNEDVEILLSLYDNLDESNQEIFLAQLEEDAEALLAFAKTIAEE